MVVLTLDPFVALYYSLKKFNYLPIIQFCERYTLCKLINLPTNVETKSINHGLAVNIKKKFNYDIIFQLLMG